MNKVDTTTSPRVIKNFFSQTIVLAQRSLVSELRQLATVLPGLLFPLLLAFTYTEQFERVLTLPGFPEVDSFLDFLLPATVLQMVSFGASNSGTELALDIENGFMDRLLASPVARVPVLIGRVGGSALLAGIKTVIIVLVFLIAGAQVSSGFAGFVVLTLSACLLVVVIGGLSQILAIRSGSQEVVGATFPLIFVMIFMSSAFFPTELMSGWFKQIAEFNPMTWIIDPLRRLMIVGWSWSDAATALGILLLGSVLITGASVRTLHKKLGRP